MQYDKQRTGKLIGGGVLALTFGLPAIERAGYGGFLGYASGSEEMLWCLATLGGALGGALVAGRNYVAGFLGGIVAGFGFTVYGARHVFDLQAMGSVQFLLLQFVGTVPGYALYRMLRRDNPDAANVSENAERFVEEHAKVPAR